MRSSGTPGQPEVPMGALCGAGARDLMWGRAFPEAHSLLGESERVPMCSGSHGVTGPHQGAGLPCCSALLTASCGTPPLQPPELGFSNNPKAPRACLLKEETLLSQSLSLCQTVPSAQGSSSPLDTASRSRSSCRDAPGPRLPAHFAPPMSGDAKGWSPTDPPGPGRVWLHTYVWLWGGLMTD